MEINGLINKINAEMKNTNSLLRFIISSKEPYMYINEFRNTEEYEFLHELVKYGILHEDSVDERSYTLFGKNANTLDALKKPELYFKQFKEKQ